MKFTFLFIALAVGALNWVAAQKKRRHLVYFAKPVTMLALLLWMIENKATDGFMLWFMLAVIFSLVGDVFLMLPKNYFLPGLASFLVAHVLAPAAARASTRFIVGQPRSSVASATLKKRQACAVRASRPSRTLRRTLCILR